MSIPSILSGVLVAAAVGAAVGATTKVAHNAYIMGLFDKMKEHIPQKWNPSKQVSDRTKETEVKKEEPVIVPEGVTCSLEPQSAPTASQSREAAQTEETLPSSTPQTVSIEPQPLERAKVEDNISSSAPQAPTTGEPSQEKAS